MNLDTSLAPRFVVFHYLIRWYIQNFGSFSYYIGVVGLISAFCVYAFKKSLRDDEWDRGIMIIIFGIIIIGGLIGLGMDISKGYVVETILN